MISELIKIQIKNIRLEEGIIHIFGKRSKERIVVIGSEAGEALRNYLELMSKKESFDSGL